MTRVVAALAVLFSVTGALSHSAMVAEQQVPARRNAIVMAVEKAGPAVVNISTEQVVVQRVSPYGNPLFDQFFQDFFGRYAERRFTATSLGSGVIIDPSGYVVTNDHVVRRAAKIHVLLSGRQKLEARLVSEDPDSDLAVLQIEGKGPFPHIELGASTDLMIGETAIALGNPFGLENTVTVGVVSAKNRSIYADDREVYKDLIQTDAAINPGNSGGPLVNTEGRLIGINTAIYAEANGIGFAIPADRVRSTLLALLDPRIIKKMVFGAHLEDIDSESIKRLRLPADTRGALVTDVETGSPADEGGLKKDDVIVDLDDRPVRGALEVLRTVLEKSPGDVLKIDVLRGDKRWAVEVRLAVVPKPNAALLARTRLGLSVQAITPALVKAMKLPVDKGSLIADVEAGGPMAQLAQRGDILLAINNLSVATLEDLGIILDQVKPGMKLKIAVVRGAPQQQSILVGVVTAR